MILILARASARVRRRASARVRRRGNGPAVFFSLYMVRSYGRPADPCLSPRQGAEAADDAAPCANLLGGPISGTVPTGTLPSEYH